MHPHSKPVYLSDEERALITDVIDIHVQGTLAAKELTTDDPTIESAEQLLDLMSGLDDDLRVLNNIRKKVNRGRQPTRSQI